MEDSKVILCGGLEVGVGVLEYESKGESDKTIEVQVILLEFKEYFDEEPIKIAIPMGTKIGDLFFTGELFMQIRDLWNEWFRENAGGGENDQQQ